MIPPAEQSNTPQGNAHGTSSFNTSGMKLGTLLYGMVTYIKFCINGVDIISVEDFLPYPCSTELLAHPSLVGSKVYFFWSPTEDYCVTVWWIWFVFVDYQVSVWSALSSVIGTFSPHQITPDTSDTDLIDDKHKSDSSDCDTIVFRRWPEEINLASDEWKMSQKLCGIGVLVIRNSFICIYLQTVSWRSLFNHENK